MNGSVVALVQLEFLTIGEAVDSDPLICAAPSYEAISPGWMQTSAGWSVREDQGVCIWRVGRTDWVDGDRVAVGENEGRSWTGEFKRGYGVWDGQGEDWI